MSILTIDWGGVSTNALAAVDPAEADAPYFTVAWVPKRGGMPLAFLEADLAVGTGIDAPGPPIVDVPPEQPTPSGGGDGSTAASGSAASGDDATPTPTVPADPATTAPAQVRPHAAPAIAVARRRSAAVFLDAGLSVRIALAEPAKVEALLAIPRSKGKRRVEITRTTTRKLEAGRTTLVLKPNAAGRKALKGHQLSTQLELTITYADGQTATVKRTVLFTPPPKRKS